MSSHVSSVALVALAAAVTTGCVDGGAYWKRVNGPDPSKLTYSVACREGMTQCYEVASRLCSGHEWRFLNATTETTGRLLGGRGFIAGRSDSKGAALLQCDWGPVQPVKEED